jgi:hypothetical protein
VTQIEASLRARRRRDGAQGTLICAYTRPVVSEAFDWIEELLAPIPVEA